MSSHDAQAPKKPRDPDPKQVFLCHSGAQKDFVTQLDKDLRSKDRYPFFDQDKESLPLGHDFPDLIFKAIKHCQVGVVVLSDEFFTLKHWPMTELVNMVECGTPHIIPIFLGISPEDLSKEDNLVKWKSKWEEWASSDTRIDLSKWESSLRHLRKYNGTLYHSAVGAVKLREEIVEGICKIVPEFHVYDDSHVQGRSRLSKVIQVKISEIPAVKGNQVVGLYGMGGIGKTTACKCLCKDLHKEFNGRVCRVEFGGETSEIDRVREVLKKLTSTNDELLHGKDLEWCWSRLKTLMQSNKVVLAIDNYVSGNSMTREEALRYLSRLEYGEGSIVMVTARALGELTNLGIESGSCLAMPELVRDEARALFLYHADPKDEVDAGVVNQFMDRCHFGKGDGKGSKHYHPLALKVLGSQLVGRHPGDWKSQLKEEDVFNQGQEQNHPVFSILRRSFDTLKFDHKMLFMDVALFDGGLFYEDWIDHWYPWHYYGVPWTTWYNVFEWLKMMHGISTEELRKRLNELRKRSLLEELGDGSSHIEMHDLWREFAEMEAKRGEEESSHWVYEFQVGDQIMAKSCMQGGGWMNLRRIFIKYSRVKCVNFRDCSKATVLRLDRVSVANEVLDLSPLGRLECLEISFPASIAAENPSGDTTHDLIINGIDKLTNLVVLVLLGVPIESLSAVAEIANLTNLRILHFTSSELAFAIKCMTVLDLQLLRYLQVVSVRANCIVSISGFSAKMTGLRFLDLGNCRKLKSCVGVGDVEGLEVLLLWDCFDLEELPNLQKLRRLRMLHIGSCLSLKTVPGLGSLVSLRVLRAGRSSLNELSDMSKLTNLEELDVSECDRLKCIGSLGDAVALRVLRVNCVSLHDVPNLGKLAKSHEVEVDMDCYKMDYRMPRVIEQTSALDLAMLGSVSTLDFRSVDRELINISKLTALKSLDLFGCHFKMLPHMGRDMILESLRIEGCIDLEGWDGVRRVESRPDSLVDCEWTLAHLKVLDWSHSRGVELPDLSHFPRLRSLTLNNETDADGKASTHFLVYCLAEHKHLEELDCRGPTIRDLPDLRKFPSLKVLRIEGCVNLTSLTVSGPVPALERVELRDCSDLDALPDVNFFPNLRYFSCRGSEAALNVGEVHSKLIARGFYDLGGFYGLGECLDIYFMQGEMSWVDYKRYLHILTPY